MKRRAATTINDEQDWRWLRFEAARRDCSVSKTLAALVHDARLMDEHAQAHEKGTEDDRP